MYEVYTQTARDGDPGHLTGGSEMGYEQIRGKGCDPTVQAKIKNLTHGGCTVSGSPGLQLRPPPIWATSASPLPLVMGQGSASPAQGEQRSPPCRTMSRPPAVALCGQKGPATEFSSKLEGLQTHRSRAGSSFPSRTGAPDLGLVL